MGALRAGDAVLASCRVMHTCEETAVAGLFQGREPPLRVLMWKDLCDWLEDAIDECDDVADALESMAAKYAT